MVVLQEFYLACYQHVILQLTRSFISLTIREKLSVLLRRWSVWAVAPFQEIRMLDFENTSGSGINVCFVSVITEKKKNV